MDVIEKLKFLGQIHKKKLGGGGGRGVLGQGGVGLVGWGQGGCEPSRKQVRVMNTPLHPTFI